MCDCTEKYIKFPKWSWVLYDGSECPGISPPDAEMNGDKYMDLQFICFHHYENTSSYYLHKQILPEHGKICPSRMNLEIVDKRRVKTRNIIVLESCSIMAFHSDYYIPATKKMAFHLPHV